VRGEWRRYGSGRGEPAHPCDVGAAGWIGTASIEAEYFRHGGILAYVLRQIARAA
jgi:hypothetical protein